MTRRVFPLVLALAISAAAAAPAGAARAPKVRTVERSVMVRPGLVDIAVVCPPGYTALIGYVARPLRTLDVVRSGRSARNEQIWRFLVHNRVSTDQEVRIELRCVRLPSGISVRSPRESLRTLAAGQDTTTVISRCPPKTKPVSASTSESAPGTRNQPPAPGAFVHTSELKPSRRGVRIDVANPGSDPVQVGLRANCVEKSGPGVRTSVRLSTTTVEVPEGGQVNRTQRCSQDSTATDGGYTLPDGTQVFPERLGFTGQHGADLLFSNPSPTAERVQSHATCLGFIRVHN